MKPRYQRFSFLPNTYAPTLMEYEYFTRAYTQQLIHCPGLLVMTTKDLRGWLILRRIES